MKVKPDTASLNLGVQATAATATEALSQTNTSGAALIATLKAAGISDDDIATSGLSIYPQYGSSSNTITGYQASNSVTVTVRDIAQTGADHRAAAAAAGDNITIGGVSFYVDDTEALIGAARAMPSTTPRSGRPSTPRRPASASVASCRSARCRSATRSRCCTPPPTRRPQLASPTPIETGTQDLTVSVTVVYEL